MLVARILPAGRERKYRILPRSSYDKNSQQFRRLSARSLFSVYNRLPPFVFRYWENSPLLPANYPTLQVHGKVYPSARIVNETTHIPPLSTSRSLGWMTCVLVILTSDRIYTGPAGGPGPTVYIVRPLQRIMRAHVRRDPLSSTKPLLMRLLTTCRHETIMDINIVAFIHVNQLLFFHLFFR